MRPHRPFMEMTDGNAELRMGLLRKRLRGGKLIAVEIDVGMKVLDLADCA